LKYLKTESIFTDSYKERRYQELIRLAQDYLEDFEDDFEDEADDVEEDDDDFFEDEGEN
jgi:hypothetical protein